MAEWFDVAGERPRLIGSRLPPVPQLLLPARVVRLPEPALPGGRAGGRPLSTSGTLWSFTDNHYAPPAPYVAPDPFQPYAIAAVELAEERMVVLGQVAPGVPTSSLEVGMRMDLVADPLYADDEHEYLVWKWRPAAAGDRP
jgi:hypothetical protein